MHRDPPHHYRSAIQVNIGGAVASITPTSQGSWNGYAWGFGLGEQLVRAGVQPLAADRNAGDLRSGSIFIRPAPTMTPLPAPLMPAALVGRDVELAELEGRLEMARHGRGGMVLLTGEPGVGKTRLLRHAADRARVAGWLVLSGRAYDGTGWPPYFPLSDAFRGYVESCPIDQLQAQLGHAARDVALVVREVHA